jgi:hypothetical protein
MPITFPAHAAAALPLRRLRALPSTALVIGTAAPDFAFLFGPHAGIWSHRVDALIWFCLPLGIFLYEVLERAVLPALRCSSRFFWVSLATRGPDRNVGRVGGAVLLGAITHLLWDAFTHADRWPANVLFTANGAAMVHLASSYLGSIAVLLWAIVQYRQRRHLAPRPTRWLKVKLAMSAAFGAMFAFSVRAVVPMHQPLAPGWTMFVGAFTAVFAASIWWAHRRKIPAQGTGQRIVSARS